MNKMHKASYSKYCYRLRTAPVIAVLIIGAMVVCGSLAHGQISRPSNYQLCFPDHGWWAAPAPNIDGKPDSAGNPDSGWQGGFRYVFGSAGGTTLPPDVVVQGVRDNVNHFLYLSIRGNNLADLGGSGSSVNSAIVLAFDPGDSTTKPNTGDPLKMRGIIIYPVNSAASANSPPTTVDSIEYWKNGLQVTTTGTYAWSGTFLFDPVSNRAYSLPSWLVGISNIAVSYGRDSTGTYYWYLEMKIPFTDNYGTLVPTTGFFGLYIDVFRGLPSSSNQVLKQSSWPPPQLEPGCPDPTIVGGTGTTCDPPRRIPDPANWGLGSIASQTCGGVSVSTDALGTNNIFSGSMDTAGTFTPHSTNSNISLDQPNDFIVYLQNTSIDGAGTPVVAQGVNATFRIANFGLPSTYVPWGEVRTDTGATRKNPTPPKDIPTNATCSEHNIDSRCSRSIGPWTLSGDLNTAGTEVYEYKNENSAHQCIMVELDAVPTGSCNSTTGAGCTVIVNNAVVRNMDFAQGASKFERSAEISAKGYPPRAKRPDGTPEAQLFDLHIIITREEALGRGTSATGSYVAGIQTVGKQDKERGRVTSQLTWVAEGCRHTGQYMTIKGKPLELCDSVGAFGYQIQHVGNAPVVKWRMSLQQNGKTLEAVPPNTYQISVPQDGVAEVTTTIEPEESLAGKFAVFADLGAGIPNGVFGNAFTTGVSFNGGLEYILNAHFSAEGILGYHHFPGKGVGDVNVFQFTGGGKVYAPPFNNNFAFARAGLGGYHFSFSPGSTTNLGGYFGGGLLHQFGSWGLEGAYTFHAVNTPGVATKFSTVQGGIRWVF